MNTAQIWQTTSTSLNDTLKLAAAVGRKLRGGEVIELVSDLGGGKTAFVRGLAGGMGSHDAVRSPSFTLSSQYHAGDLTIYHFDLYRLKKPGIMRHELTEILDDPKAVVVVEWGKIVEDFLPAKRLTINVRATGETIREITFEYPEPLRYLVPETT